MIFDDSFSALDYKTDRALRKALGENTVQTTKLIVAQRIGTIRYADQIIVLEHGKIVGKGTHEELLRTCVTYQEKINKLPLKYFNSHSTGDVLSRVTNDVDTVGQTMNQSFSTLVSSVSLLIGSVLMMFLTNWIMAVTGMLQL